MTPPTANACLEYPRQAIVLTSYNDINNLAIVNTIVVIDVALHDIDDIITNNMQRVQ